MLGSRYRCQRNCRKNTVKSSIGWVRKGKIRQSASPVMADFAPTVDIDMPGNMQKKHQKLIGIMSYGLLVAGIG